ncbi:substrate-binding domain-containing protein [Eubacteriales bacterium OttesenSCG-928-M02]|nr:substrate-binding domain-containing protein [Eubacteriales bacterium OttesenSCG-928-M02]
MDNRRYYTKAGLMSFIAVPCIVSAGILIGLYASGPLMWLFRWTGIGSFLSIALFPSLFLIAAWHFFFRKRHLPDTWGKRLLPLAAAFVYYVGLWALVFGISHYSYHGEAWQYFTALSLPYFLPNLLFSIADNFIFFPIMQLAVLMVSVLTMFFTCRKKQPKAAWDKTIWLSLACVLVLCCTTGFQYYRRTTQIFTRDATVERVEDEVDLYDYEPFRTGNLLVKTPTTPTLQIDTDYPRLDGATAAYPVYGAMAQAIYRGLDQQTVGAYVSCTKTNEAYERLIRGEIDIFFGAQPSQQQVEAAKEQGLEFEMLPIAKEAFVFFVNRDNPVDDLTLAQIQDIYTKKITNWREVGGASESILAFQRPENSGSQTIMLAKVMQGTSLPEPLREEYAAGMGGVINQVATYRNYTSSIGYSFRFFATDMRTNEHIKLIAINGIEPSVENIQNGSYPFTVDVYAVTARPKSENTQKLLDWIVSEEGQTLIERCGYVGR